MYTPLAIASEAREPKPAHQAILPWLDMLRQLYPPSALLLVGAGSGSSPWVQYLIATGHRNVTLIEADETTANRLKIATQEHPDWTVKSHVIARHSAPTAFYTASLQTESGLLEPESLRSLWPNLKTTHKQTREAIALAELQEDAETPANWLMVDCLPALPIIRGAAQQLAAIDVISLRVLLNDNALPISAPGASADELQTTLQALGFRCLAIETSRHPAIGQALFVRDTAAQVHQLQQQLAHQAQTLAQAKAAADKLAAERQQQIDQLKQTAEHAKAAAKTAAEAQAAAAAATKQAEERAAQIQQLIQAQAAADKLLGERQQQIGQLKQAAEQAQAAAKIAAEAQATAVAAKQAEERAAQVYQLTQAKAAADKLATERQQQIDQLQSQVKQTTEQAQAAAQEAQKAQAAAAAATASTAAAAKQAEERAAQVQQLTQAKTAADKLLGERMAQIQAHEQRLRQLQAHRAETDHLSGLLQAELTKAEAQIALLKELFFREPGL